MKTIVPYIEAIKDRLHFATYEQTMKHIGMTKQAWTAIQNGAGVSEKNAIRIGQILDIDPVEIMAVSFALRAKNTECRNLWLKHVKKLEKERLTNGKGHEAA